MRHLLKEDGLFLLHTIGVNRVTKTINAWTNRYIFPNGYIPSPAQISSVIEGFFVLEDWQSFGADYDRTLMSWYRNFEEKWPSLKELYSDRFYRMWKYFLLCSAGSFRARWIQLWQIVLSPKGVPGVYHAPR
jgi:cyclopropane-fatty-acyl-phospholipid synthase